ncbi:helicase HerA-like domain-containing protein [uncultured Vagococcus sp.]|uniref:helicase HerA-like domain-containing protein n=1 Tax=uncultured Vagococcus sp. TaxID=189676 RepID=UPI0028D6CED7|nr:helicase HerA-like domain-containing protein [uncultured Vagococcus sp.]
MSILPIAVNQHDLGLKTSYINRHGFITGATGTGKTVTLKVMAEQLSQAGIPVFLADIKGDLASLAQSGGEEKMVERAHSYGINGYEGQAFPVRLWDVFGELGHPVRATISEMGPLLLARLFQLNDTQTDVLQVIFKIADDKGYLLIDIKDLQAMLGEVSNHLDEYTGEYGHLTKQSIGAIQRHLLTIEEQGGESFFGEPSIRLSDFMQNDSNGNGFINILMAQKLYQSPMIYATMLLWLLSELFEELPEVGDLEKPKLVFFFDEAHLLFKDMSKGLIEQVEKVVRLIRSKGVGVYFVTQNPVDIPEIILSQLGNRIQHALRAYTPKEQKAIKAAAQSYRSNPDLDVEKALTELEVGEALVSFLDENGTPSMVERARIRPPQSKMGTIDESLYQQLITQSPYDRIYRETVDRESAYELLARKLLTEKELEAAEELRKEQEKIAKEKAKETEKKAKEDLKKQKNNPVSKFTNTFMTQLFRTASREIIRGAMGVFKKK